MGIKDLFKDYKALQEDYNLLSLVKKKMTKDLLDTGDVEDLMCHNQAYRRHIEMWLMAHIPETVTDLQKWSEEDVEAWLDFLVTCSVLYYDQKEKIIGLFWLLDSQGKIQHKEKVALICTHPSMVDYAADPRNKSVVKTLWLLIDKYATLSQAEQFQNRVDLAKNEIY